MKKFIVIKVAVILTIFIASLFLVASCGNDQKLEDNKDVAEQPNDTNTDNNNEVAKERNATDDYKQEKDAQFLATAAELNREEILLGKLAQQKGATSEVKELGKMMEDAHTKSLTDLTALAKSKMITIPTASTNNAQEAYKTLNEKLGNDFDKAYADKMVSSHKDAIAAFEIASNDSYDAEIKNWATASLPGLRKHLDHSVDSQKKFDGMYLKKNN